jgi:hypothetical protein
MWWKGVKILAVASAALVTLLFIGILIMVTRPALLLGVDGESLANSVAGRSGQLDCRQLPDDTWLCPKSGRHRTPARVDVDWMGCWKIKPKREIPDDPMSEGPGDLDATGCIELGDIFAFD